MSIRFRTLAALLALFAFSASLAEQVWASACAPAARVEAASAAAGMDHGAMPGHPAPAPGHDPRDNAPAPGSDCPLHAVASAGCTFVLLPAAAAAFSRPHAPPSQTVATVADALSDLLLASGPFHPPQR